MKSLFILFLTLSFSVAQAETIFSLRDWSAEKSVETVLGEEGCVAETIFKDEDQNNWHLQVIKLKNQEGDYSSPVVMAFPETPTNVEYFEGSAQSDRPGTLEFSMTLFQSKNQLVSPIGSRLSDKVEMLRRISKDNSFKVKFLSKNQIVKEVPYSLSGSSKTISAMDSACK